MHRDAAVPTRRLEPGTSIKRQLGRVLEMVPVAGSFAEIGAMLG